MKLRDLDDTAPPPADHDALAEVQRRGRRKQRRRLATRGSIAVVIIAGLVAGAIAIGGRDDGRRSVTVEPTTTKVGAPNTFVSTRDRADGGVNVAISDARTGAIEQTLYTAPARTTGSYVSGTAIAATGEVWITVNRGPRMLGHVAGGAPQAHSCSSEVVQIDPRTGAQHTLTLGSDDELITDVQPSPTGGRIAYLHSGCADYYFDNSLQVKDLATDAVVSIGAQLPRCHILATPRWSLDGAKLAVLYGAASGPEYQGPLGGCTSPETVHVALVSALASQPGVAAPLTAPVDPGCQVAAVAVTKNGYAGVEQCGPSDFIDGPARLVRYDSALEPVSSAPLGSCEDGASIAGDRASRSVIISTYQFCNPPGTTNPVTKVFTDTGTGPHLLSTIPGGNTAVDFISF
jgi:hypothetical protein